MGSTPIQKVIRDFVRGRQFIVLLLGLGFLLLLGGMLRQQWDVNWKWLAGKRQIVRTGEENPCPDLTLAQTASVVGESGSSPRLQTLRALSFIARHQPASAMEVYAAMGDKASQTDLFRYGCAAWSNKETGLAIEEWRQAQVLDYFLNHGALRMREHTPDRARSFFEIATLVQPDSAEAWIGLAQSEFDLAVARKIEWVVARQSAERALVLAPDDARPHYLVGANLWRSQIDLTRAERELRLALGKSNGWLEKYALAGLLLDMGKHAEPAQLLEQVLEQQDTQAVRYQLVRAQLEDRQCARAAVTRQAALAKYPDMQADLQTLCKRSAACPCANNP